MDWKAFIDEARQRGVLYDVSSAKELVACAAGGQAPDFWVLDRLPRRLKNLRLALRLEFINVCKALLPNTAEKRLHMRAF